MLLTVVILYIIIRLIVSESNKQKAAEYSKKWNAEHKMSFGEFDPEKFKRNF